MFHGRVKREWEVERRGLRDSLPACSVFQAIYLMVKVRMEHRFQILSPALQTSDPTFPARGQPGNR